MHDASSVASSLAAPSQPPSPPSVSKNPQQRRMKRIGDLNTRMTDLLNSIDRALGHAGAEPRSPQQGQRRHSRPGATADPRSGSNGGIGGGGGGVGVTSLSVSDTSAAASTAATFSRRSSLGWQHIADRGDASAAPATAGSGGFFDGSVSANTDKCAAFVVVHHRAESLRNISTDALSTPPRASAHRLKSREDASDGNCSKHWRPLEALDNDGEVETTRATESHNDSFTSACESHRPRRLVSSTRAQPSPSRAPAFTSSSSPIVRRMTPQDAPPSRARVAAGKAQESIQKTPLQGAATHQHRFIDIETPDAEMMISAIENSNAKSRRALAPSSSPLQLLIDEEPDEGRGSSSLRGPHELSPLRQNATGRVGEPALRTPDGFLLSPSPPRNREEVHGRMGPQHRESEGNGRRDAHGDGYEQRAMRDAIRAELRRQALHSPSPHDQREDHQRRDHTGSGVSSAFSGAATTNADKLLMRARLQREIAAACPTEREGRSSRGISPAAFPPGEPVRRSASAETSGAWGAAAATAVPEVSDGPRTVDSEGGSDTAAMRLAREKLQELEARRRAMRGESIPPATHHDTDVGAPDLAATQRFHDDHATKPQSASDDRLDNSARAPLGARAGEVVSRPSAARADASTQAEAAVQVAPPSYSEMDIASFPRPVPIPLQPPSLEEPQRRSGGGQLAAQQPQPVWQRPLHAQGGTDAGRFHTPVRHAPPGKQALPTPSATPSARFGLVPHLTSSAVPEGPRHEDGSTRASPPRKLPPRPMQGSAETTARSLSPRRDPRARALHQLRTTGVSVLLMPELGQFVDCVAQVQDDRGVAVLALRPAASPTEQSFSLRTLQWLCLPFAANRPRLGIFCGPRARQDLRAGGYSPKLKRKNARVLIAKLGPSMLIFNFRHRSEFLSMTLALHALRWPNVVVPLRRGALLWMLARHLILSKR